MIGAPVQQDSLTIQTQAHSDATVVSLGGGLTRSSARQARVTLFEALQGRPRRLVTNLAQVKGFDEAGIGMLLISSLWARKCGVEFAIIPSQVVRDQLTAAKLDRYLSLIDAL